MATIINTQYLYKILSGYSTNPPGEIVRELSVEEVATLENGYIDFEGNIVQYEPEIIEEIEQSADDIIEDIIESVGGAEEVVRKAIFTPDSIIIPTK